MNHQKKFLHNLIKLKTSSWRRKMLNLLLHGFSFHNLLNNSYFSPMKWHITVQLVCSHKITSLKRNLFSFISAYATPLTVDICINFWLFLFEKTALKSFIKKKKKNLYIQKIYIKKNILSIRKNLGGERENYWEVWKY